MESPLPGPEHESSTLFQYGALTKQSLQKSRLEYSVLGYTTVEYSLSGSE